MYISIFESLGTNIHWSFLEHRGTIAVLRGLYFEWLILSEIKSIVEIEPYFQSFQTNWTLRLDIQFQHDASVS